jgi:hypothetical protein
VIQLITLAAGIPKSWSVDTEVDTENSCRIDYEDRDAKSEYEIPAFVRREGVQLLCGMEETQ